MNYSNSKKSENSSSRPETASTRVSDSDKMPEIIQGLKEYTFGMDFESLLVYDQLIHKEQSEDGVSTKEDNFTEDLDKKNSDDVIR